MKLSVLFVALVVVSSTPVLARIGDTQAAVEQSLGKGYTSDDDAPFKVPADCVYRSYAKGDILCGVYFLQGKSICECYGKYGYAPFSNVELSGFLAANASEKPWKESVDGSMTSWSTEDNGIFAGYPLTSRNLLVVRLPSFDRLTAQEAQAQDRQHVGNFFAAATPTPTSTPSTPKVWPDSAFKTPQPPYPAQARATHVSGSSVARVMFDEKGRVASVTIIRSAGSAILDLSTETYAKANWSGPASATKDVTCVYRFQ